jgi:hypothetical protein
MKSMAVPVVSGCSRTATPLGGVWDLITIPSGWKQAVLSTWNLRTAEGTLRTTKKGSRGTKGLAVLEAIFTPFVGKHIS